MSQVETNTFDLSKFPRNVSMTNIKSYNGQEGRVGDLPVLFNKNLFDCTPDDDPFKANCQSISYKLTHKSSGMKIRLVNIHLKNDNVNGKEKGVLTGELVNLQGRLDKLRVGVDLLILCGDFNCQLWTKSGSRLKRDSSNELVWFSNVMGCLTDKQNFPTSGKEQAIDHIFLQRIYKRGVPKFNIDCTLAEALKLEGFNHHLISSTLSFDSKVSLNTIPPVGCGINQEVRKGYLVETKVATKSEHKVLLQDFTVKEVDIVEIIPSVKEEMVSAVVVRKQIRVVFEGPLGGIYYKSTGRKQTPTYITEKKPKKIVKVLRSLVASQLATI